jgi:hypothetical protein
MARKFQAFCTFRQVKNSQMILELLLGEELYGILNKEIQYTLLNCWIMLQIPIKKFKVQAGNKFLNFPLSSEAFPQFLLGLSFLDPFRRLGARTNRLKDPKELDVKTRGGVNY